MNDYQKVLFSQLQIAGLGIVVIIMGLLKSDSLKIFIPIGACIFLFGLIRFLFLRSMLKKTGRNSYDLIEDQKSLYADSSLSGLFESHENLREAKNDEQDSGPENKESHSSQ